MVSESWWNRSERNCHAVLILVLVEDGLGEDGEVFTITGVDAVLILVLVEDGLGVLE